MSPRLAWLVAKKELLEVRRDLRTVLLLIVLPALLYPLLMLAAARAGEAGMQRLNATTVRVVVEDGVPDYMRDAVVKHEGVSVVAAEAEHEATLRPRKEPAAGPRDVELEVDSANERGLLAQRRLLGVLETAAVSAREGRLDALGVAEEARRLDAVEIVDVATPEQRGGFLLGRMMVAILIAILLLGAYYPAVESTVGERERQTLRTLLCAPVSPLSIAAGKLLAVSSVALVAVAANLAGLLFTARVGLVGASGFEIPLVVIAVVGALAIPMAVYVTAILMATAATMRSVREAQTLLTPLVMVLIAPAAVAAIPGMETTWMRAALPIFGPALVIRDALAGDLNLVHALAALVGGVVVAAVAVSVAARAFTTEALVTGRVKLPVRRPGPLEPSDAALLALAIAAGFVLVGVPLQSRSLLGGVVATQLLVFAGLPLAALAVRSTRPGEALGLRWRVAPGTGLSVIGALLIVPGAAAATTRIALRAVTDDERAALGKLAEALEGEPLWAIALVFTVVPAVCEEIAFRGVLQPAWTKRFGLLGILGAAAVFAAFHGSVARVAPTLVVGAIAGFVAYRTGAFWTAVVVHLAHNTLTLVLGTVTAKSAAAAMGSVEGSPFAIAEPHVYVLALVGVSLWVYVERKRRGAGAHSVGVPTSS